MKRSILALAVAAVLSGCASVPGSQELAAVGTAAVDAFTGPDTDYKNYLTACRYQIKSQVEALEADSKALAAGLSSADKETRQGTLLVLAFKAGQGSPRVGCSIDRRPGFTELLLQNNNIVDSAIRLYGINRADRQFSRRIEVEKELAQDRMNFEFQLEQLQNDLITTITGDKIELQESQQQFQLDRARIPAVPAP